MKKRMYLLLIVAVAFIFVGGTTLCQYDAQAAAKPILIKFNYAGPQAPPSVHPLSEAIRYFAEKLETNSGGRFKVEVYYGASLYNDDPTQYAALRSNVIQMCEVSGGRLGGEIPETFLMELPFAFKDMDHVYNFFTGKGKEAFEPLYLKHGYKLMAFWQYGLQNFVCSKRFLATPADFKGVKLRIRPSKLVESQLKALGASAQAIPYMETYTALQLKTIDGAECPLAVIQAVKWHETGNYITISRHSLLFAAILANPKFYDSLPDDLKKVMEDTIADATTYGRQFQENIEMKMPWIMMSENNNQQFKWLSEKERKVLKEAVQPVWAEYKDKIPQKFFDILKETEGK
ncbi:MAG: TRAP transporter substrate-binding protein [Deltaproteobacteria bacterium]|nr:TRAP transporter substrate-binding protein [Deltaproteobacteria bacterium]